VRCSDGSSFGCGDYGYANITNGDYGKVILKEGVDYQHGWQTHPWNATGKVEMLLFYMGQGGSTITPVAKPVGCLLPPTTNPLNGKPAFCRDYYGAGQRFAVEGHIVVSAFIGAPKVDIDTYQVFK